MSRFRSIRAAIALVLIAAPLAFAAQLQDYSMYYLYKNPDGSVFRSISYYLRDGDKLRADYAAGNGVIHTIEILRNDKGLVWSLDTMTKQYREVPLKKGSWDRLLTSVFAEEAVKAKKTGTTKFMNYACDVYEAGSGEWTNIFTVEPGMNVILRSELKQNGKTVQIVEAADVRPEKPAAALFEIPAGYKKQADS